MENVTPSGSADVAGHIRHLARWGLISLAPPHQVLTGVPSIALLIQTEMKFFTFPILSTSLQVWKYNLFQNNINIQ
jgi:hypothetical protein